MSHFDLVLRNANILDGRGGVPFHGDIAIADGLIAEVGNVVGKGAEEIDVGGNYVTPGFVDPHTHYDGQITWESRLVPSSNHGVTTVVMGNCGVGFAPVRKDDREIAIKLMEGVEDVPEVVMAEGLPWNWTTFPEYLDALDQRQADVDFATQMPHSPLRVFVMGKRGADLEPATDQDLTEMRRLTKEAIEAGALGVSTSRNLFHRFRSGKLAPSVNSPEAELVAMAMGLADAQGGVFQCVPSVDNTPQMEMGVLRNVARQSGRPVNFSLVGVGTDLNSLVDGYTTQLDEAQAEGLDLRAHFLPRALGVLYGLDLSYHPFSLNPSFREIAGLPLEKKVAVMRDPQVRERLLAELPADPNPMFASMVQRREYLFRISDPVDYRLTLADSLNAEAERKGVPLDDVIYDALLEDEGRAILGMFGYEPAHWVNKSESLLVRDDAVVSLGDGGAHYGMICDAGYPTFMLAQMVHRDRSNLPQIIEQLTSRPAWSVGLQDRGVVAPGFKADLNVLDIDRMHIRRPTVKHDLPSGGKRLSQKADGYIATIVSGQITHREGEPTGALPGRLVRGARKGPENRIA